MEKSKKEKFLKLMKDMDESKSALLFGMIEEYGLVKTLDYFLGRNWALQRNEDGGIIVIPIESTDESVQTYKQKKCDDAHKYHRKKRKKLHKSPWKKCN